jgi:hypothetical protein
MVLLWLVPSVAVTLVAMLWVSWAGREGRGAVDREVALRRMARVLDPAPGGRSGVLGRLRRRRTPPTYAVTPRRDRSTGLAVRPSRAVVPEPTPRAEPTQPAQPTRQAEPHRRAS